MVSRKQLKELQTDFVQWRYWWSCLWFASIWNCMCDPLFMEIR